MTKEYLDRLAIEQTGTGKVLYSKLWESLRIAFELGDTRYKVEELAYTDSYEHVGFPTVGEGRDISYKFIPEQTLRNLAILDEAELKSMLNGVWDFAITKDQLRAASLVRKNPQSIRNIWKALSIYRV